MNYSELLLKIPSFYTLLIIFSGIVICSVLLNYFLLKKKIAFNISNQIEKWDLGKGKITLNYPDWILLFFGSYIEKLSIKYGLNLPVLMGLDSLWIKQIRKNKKTLTRILKYSPDRGLFAVMKAVLDNPGLQSILLDWIDKSGEFMVLRKIALSGNGEPFDGKKARSLFGNNISEINEMMGDFEWKVRYFAINILIHDDGKNSKDAVWESFRDPGMFVRIVPVKFFETGEREKLYKNLEFLILNDPSFEVRKAASKRISDNLPDLYKITPSKLNITQKLHLIELMRPDSKQDENLAIEFMKTGNTELELYASRFLTVNGTLERLLLSAEIGYSKGLEDTYSIFKIAVGVNCTSFINLSGNDISMGTLLLASRLLLNNGDRNIITQLLQKTLLICKGHETFQPFREIYENSIVCACKRGNDEALFILNSEIIRRKYDKQFQKWVLSKLPADRENIFAPTLLAFLKDENYNSKFELEKAICRLPVSNILPEIIDILKEKNGEWAKSIKINALKILGALKLPHCTQYILENLSILSIEEAKQYSVLLSKNDNRAFRDKVSNILSFGDALSMSHIIAALPETDQEAFLPEIKKSLHDSDPEVRIAALWSLSDYHKGELLSSCFDLLKDPVEYVREEAGIILGTIASSNVLSELQKTLFDINESSSVKKAVLQGLGASSHSEVLDIILLKLEEDIELQEESIITLSKRDSPDEVITILKFMDGTTPSIRENIIKAIKMMGDKVEKIIEELLFQENTIIHKHAVSILEEAGIVDLRIRQLAHRDPEVRRKAAEFLLKAGTKKAFRGIILAAKDPDKEVRIQLVKALDKLNSAEGFVFLEELKNDPEKRVRKYTLWALERYEAKRLV